MRGWQVGVGSAALLLIGTGCGLPGSTNQTLSMRDMALQAGDLPAGMHRCSSLSGAYPDVVKDFPHPDNDQKAWSILATFGALDGWNEVYDGNTKFCSAGIYAGASQAGVANSDLTANSGFVTNTLIRYRDQGTAEQAFQTGRFLPTATADWLNRPISGLVSGGIDVKGSGTGLGPNSRVYYNEFFPFRVYEAIWQKGDLIASVVTLQLPQDQAQNISTRINGRLPASVATAATSGTTALCAGIAGGTGAISGDQLGYPGPGVPALKIYAIRTDNIKSYCWASTAQSQRSYRISGLTPGSYYVVAYPQDKWAMGFIGAYTRFVTCGMTASCNDNSLIPVPVVSGQKVTGINPNDYQMRTPLPTKPVE